MFTRWKGCAICLRKYLATCTPSSTVRLRLESVRCSWIHRGSFPRLSALANRCEEGGEDINPQVGAQAACYPVPCEEVGVPRGPDPHLVSKDHETVVCLAPDGATHTLGCVAHGIKSEEVILTDLELVPQVL